MINEWLKNNDVNILKANDKSTKKVYRDKIKELRVYIKGITSLEIPNSKKWGMIRRELKSNRKSISRNERRKLNEYATYRMER